MARRQITRRTAHEEAVLRLMLREPNLRCTEIAERVGVTPTWVSIVTNSELFQEEYRLRREVFQDAMLGDVRARMEEMAHAILDELTVALEKPGCSTRTLLRALEIVHKALGYGPGTRG